jgi:hypothetical protein
MGEQKLKNIARPVRVYRLKLDPPNLPPPDSKRPVEINPNWALSQFVLAGALALKGLPAEAAEVCAAARRLSPNFTIAKFRAEAVSDNPVYLAQRERLHEGLRLAGVPES